MYLEHRPSLPYCYYDKEQKKVIFKLISNDETASVKIMYGDPYKFNKITKNNSPSMNEWRWIYEEAALSVQYSSGDRVMWRCEITPPLTKRLKYAFAVTNKNNNRVYLSENGATEFTDECIYKPYNHFHYPFIHETDTPDTPAWASETIWYQIFPERFYNGKPSISPKDTESWDNDKPKSRSFYGGDLYGIIEKLPYIKDLGVTGIYMTPVFKSPTNHKYDTQDYMAVDEHFGDKETLKELVSKAHELGIKVMLDAVFNHIGSKHPFWQDVLKNQEKSKYKDYFHIRSFPVQTEYKDRDSLNYDTFAFAVNMPKWNTENIDARKYLIDAAVYWIKECDIDGWRMDVSDEVSFSFWRDFNKAVNEQKKDVYILGELWHDPEKWLSGGYFDAVMNYPLGRLISGFFLGKQTDPDIFAEDLTGKLMKFSDIHNRVQFNLLDSHDTTRFLTQANGDKLAMKNSFLFMMLMKGTPCIYYGTEIGMEGAGDPDCRRPMIWDKSKQDLQLQEFFKKLIALRKKYNKLVQNAVISYTREENLCCWTLSYVNEQIQILYNTGTDIIKTNKRVLLSTNNDITILPGKTAAVCLI